nr:MAG TPA: hypothetical protein [Crassvirales sp.]
MLPIRAILKCSNRYIYSRTTFKCYFFISF